MTAFGLGYSYAILLPGTLHFHQILSLRTEKVLQSFLLWNKIIALILASNDEFAGPYHPSNLNHHVCLSTGVTDLIAELVSRL